MASTEPSPSPRRRCTRKVAVDQRHTLRDLVLRLVAPGPQGEPVRSRVPRRMVATDTERDHLIEQLVAARLVTSDDGVLEITHEALARAWPRLRGWLDDDVEGQRMLHHLSAAADAWDSMDRPDSELYRGVRLARIRDWRAGSTTTLTDTEQAFLVASQEQAELEERSAEERARAQARLIRRLRVVLTGAVVLLVLALAAGGVAAVQSKRAGDNEAQAVASKQAAEQGEFTTLVRQAALRSEATDDVDLSLLLAVAATRLDSSPESAAALGRALSRNPALISSRGDRRRGPHVAGPQPGRPHRGHRSTPTTGCRCSTRGRGGCWPTSAGGRRQGGPLPALHRVQPRRAAARRGHDRVVAPTGRPPRRPDPCGGEHPAGRAAPGGAGALRTSPTARTVATWRQHCRSWSRGEGTLEVASTWAAVWRLDRPSKPDLLRLSEATGRPFVALSPDGGRLYALPDRVVHDLRTGERATFFPGASGLGRPPSTLSPNGRWLAFGAGANQGTAVVDTRSLREVRRLGEESQRRRRAVQRRRQPAAHHLLGPPRPARVWEVATGRMLADLSFTGRSASWR